MRCRRTRRGDLASRLDAATRHRHIQQHDVWQLVAHHAHRLLRILGLADHIDVRHCTQGRDHSFTKQRMIVGDDDANRIAHTPAGRDNGQQACTVVPTPTAESTSNAPPSSSARSRACQSQAAGPFGQTCVEARPVVRHAQPQSVARAVQLDLHVGALAVSRCIRKRFLKRA